MAVKFVQKKISTFERMQEEIDRLSQAIQELKSEWEDYVLQSEKKYTEKHSKCVYFSYWQDIHWNHLFDATSIDQLMKAFGGKCCEGYPTITCSDWSNEKKEMLETLKPKFREYLAKLNSLESKMASVEKKRNAIQEELKEIWELCEGVLGIHKEEVEKLEELLIARYGRDRKPLYRDY